MADIEVQLHDAMHAAAESMEASPDRVIRQVKRRHRRRTTRLSVAAALAATAITVSGVVALQRATSTSGSPPASPAAAPPTRLSASMTGLPIPAGMPFEFLVPTANGAGWYSTATGQTEPIEGLPATPGGYQFERLAGGWAAKPLTYSSPCPVNQCAGPPVVFYFLGYGSVSATRIGTGYAGDGVDPGARAGTVWLVTYPRTTTSLNASSFMQLVSTAGQPLGPRYRMPADYLMGRGIGRYLLLDFDGNNETHFELWDPATRRVLGHYDNVVAQGPEQVVWSNGCGSCRLEITNVSTGTTVTTSIPGSAPATLNAALSDDGRLLAVLVPGHDVTVVNTETGATTSVPGTALSATDHEEFDWQNGGHRLIITAGPNSLSGPNQIAYWQPGDSRLHVTTIRNTNDLTALETGSY